jgi:CRP-like cAMP-binding protein
VATVSECQLLSLDVGAFRRLMDSHPDVRASIVRVAELRLGERREPPAGSQPPLSDR